jgi:hypothetical protein
LADGWRTTDQTKFQQISSSILKNIKQLVPPSLVGKQGGFIQAEKKLGRVDLIRHVELGEWFGNQKLDM